MNNIEDDFYTLLSMDLEITIEHAYEASVALSDKLDVNLSLYLCGFELVESDKVKEKERNIIDKKHKKLVKYNKKKKLDIPEHPGYPKFYLSEVKKLGVEVRRDHNYDFYPNLEIRPLISKAASELKKGTHSSLEREINNLLLDYITPSNADFHSIMMNMAKFVYELVILNETSEKILEDNELNISGIEWYKKCYEETLSILASRNGKIPVKAPLTKKMFLDILNK